MFVVPNMDNLALTLVKPNGNYTHATPMDPLAMMASLIQNLPFAMSRFCTAEGVENVITLSMMRSRNFAKDYGVLIEDGPLAGITARAVVVLDSDNNVIHSELVGEIANEPDYEAAIKSLA